MSLKWKDHPNVIPAPNKSEGATTAITQGILLLNARNQGKHEDARPTFKTTWTKTRT